MGCSSRASPCLFYDTPSVFCFAKSTSPATQGHSGWNKVVLLTAVRNSPCSCPFSVSLHPPLAALNSEPQRGRLNVRVWTSTKRLPHRGSWKFAVSEFSEGVNQTNSRKLLYNFFAGGPGKISISPLRPPCTPP